MRTDHINIKFPFQESTKGYFYDSNIITSDAIKSDLLHVLLTKKGERFYSPNFGTNLYKYLFEPNDDITITDIIAEANASLAYCMPNITISKLEVTEVDNNRIELKIIAVNTDDVFINNIIVEVTI